MITNNLNKVSTSGFLLSFLPFFIHPFDVICFYTQRFLPPLGKRGNNFKMFPLVMFIE